MKWKVKEKEGDLIINDIRLGGFLLDTYCAVYGKQSCHPCRNARKIIAGRRILCQL